MKYFLSIDQSTSDTKSVIFNTEVRLIARANVDHSQYYPQPGLVEHDPVEIYENTIKAIREVVTKSEIATTDNLGLPSPAGLQCSSLVV